MRKGETRFADRDAHIVAEVTHAKYADVGKRHGVSRTRVGQIVAQAKRREREAAQAHDADQ